MNGSRHTGDALPRSADKFELHYRQQLSALVDGELSGDEGRFLLRRLQHDEVLSACQERWQVLGDVLRGQACAPAPADFGARVSAAVAAEPAPAARSNAPGGARGGSWMRWSGGAALAASVAAVALFMAREQVPVAAPVLPETVIATTAQMPVPVPGPGEARPAVVAAVTPPAAAVASARRSGNAPPRGSATRQQQVARAAAARQAVPERALAVQAPARHREDPFADAGMALQARPWPRSALSPALTGSGFSASLPAAGGGTAFYPFEPRLPVQDAPAVDEPQVPH
ncbi:sigma-E factor negative regulatory protein [Stenotrophomonas mori]|uniref:Sigma-E factor negative regulatory protein n=1 Tax=Stenotrophomonas mori TaxID=2871096 RepID=A0ABT0SDS8_9GAMM|nr:sigma-E factor negative regulatory protein [Stenotrophomonas mori]MCL7713233.1 sigma-E factor negative regulatory protein [Stenotrophomonas mori]